MKFFLIKYIYLITPALILFFAGCSSTYRVTDFKSKNEFYNNVNNNIKDREVNVTLNNDSTFATNDKGAQVEQNYLSLRLNRTVLDTTLPLSEIQNINYKTKHGNPSTYIELKNGATINAENIRRSAGSLEFNTRVPYPYNIPINKVNEIGYKSTSEGIFSGIFIGMGAGLLLTISKIIPANLREGNPPYPNDYNYFGVGRVSIPLGIIVGGIVGAIIGHHYNYEFR